MAEASVDPYDDQICPYFLNSSCRFGDRCRFIHPKRTCRFYLEGRCRFGDSCWNSHGNNVEEYTPRQVSPNRFNNYLGRPRGDNQPATNHFSQNASANRNPDKKTERFHGGSYVGLDSVRKTNDRVDWIDTQEFVNSSKKSSATAQKQPDICLDFANGRCLLNDRCPLIHGELCDFCRKACLSPCDAKQRENHMELCCKKLDEMMKLQTVQELGQGKMCGICMDIVLEKEPTSERRFGILENCNHVFCFMCIMKWRNVKTHRSGRGSEVDPSVIHCCPECRVPSPFVVSSKNWFATEDEKKKMVKDRKEFLGRRPCRFFKQGRGECPYGGACYYLHALPNGTKVNLPVPEVSTRSSEESNYLSVHFFELLDHNRFHEWVEQFMPLSSESEFDYDEDDFDDDFEDTLSFMSDAHFPHDTIEFL